MLHKKKIRNLSHNIITRDRCSKSVRINNFKLNVYLKKSEISLVTIEAVINHQTWGYNFQTR